MQFFPIKITSGFTPKKYTFKKIIISLGFCIVLILFLSCFDFWLWINKFIEEAWTAALLKKKYVQNQLTFTTTAVLKSAGVVMKTL